GDQGGAQLVRGSVPGQKRRPCFYSHGPDDMIRPAGGQDTPPSPATGTDRRGAPFLLYSRPSRYLAEMRRRMPRLAFPSRTASLIALLAMLLWGHAVPPAQAADETLPDFAVVNGYYFSEAAGGDPAHGYTISDEGGIPFWDAFQRLGDVDAIGYPATNRFTWQGFVDQATQKLILQWNPASQTVDV